MLDAAMIAGINIPVATKKVVWRTTPVTTIIHQRESLVVVQE